MQRLYEWKLMNTVSNSSSASTPSKGYKNRFKKLIDYAQAHTAPTVVKTEVIELENYSFHYKEYFEKNGSEWTYSTLVNTSRFDDKWAIKVFLDGNFDSSRVGEGYEDLIKALSFYMNTPRYGTSEYNDLLIESFTNTAEDFKTYENMWD